MTSLSSSLNRGAAFPGLQEKYCSRQMGGKIQAQAQKRNELHRPWITQHQAKLTMYQPFLPFPYMFEVFQVQGTRHGPLSRTATPPPIPKYPHKAGRKIC